MSKKSMGYSWIAFEESPKPFKSWSSILGATMERSIPHIRSIFTTPSQRKKSASSDTQDLCQYDKSPRNNRQQRRPKDPPTDYSALDPTPKQQQQQAPPSKSRPNKENLKNGNYNTYTSKTLTEKDMRHLERHLSMKKTIRKQISRNLAQAFLDNPDIFEPEDYTNPKPSEVHRADHQLPNSEQNVLDLLKVSIEDRDSGHSSPTHEALEDTDVEEDDQEGWRSRGGHRDSETKGLVDDRSKQEVAESKKSSIWRMFSSRNKTKR